MGAVIARCDYSDTYGDCGKRGTRVELSTLLIVGHYCHEHTAWIVAREGELCVAE